MKTEIVGIWNGDFKEVISILCCKTKELRVRVKNKRLILKDSRFDFYSCIIIGDAIEIPVYETQDEEDEIIIMEEPKVLSQEDKNRLSSEQEAMFREWGLL